MVTDAELVAPGAAATGGPAIEAAALSRSFTTGRGRNRRSIEAVEAISFSVDRGERLAFIGPNGAGKSTSIKMLTGILNPTAGTATVLGLTPWRQRRRLTERIGVLFGQRSQLWAELSPRASLRMLGAIYRIDDRQLAARVAELGELLDATELFDQPVRTHSLGQRMRCELAACMLHRPELLFLDEPTIGLDLLAKQLFRQLLVRLNTELGTTVFLTSHDVADIEHVAQRAIVVNHGSIIYDDTVAVLRRQLLASKRIEIGLGHAVDVDDVAARLGTGIELASASDAAIVLDVDTAARSIREVIDLVLRQLPVADLSVVDPPLDQVIGEIYQRPA